MAKDFFSAPLAFAEKLRQASLRKISKVCLAEKLLLRKSKAKIVDFVAEKALGSTFPHL